MTESVALIISPRRRDLGGFEVSRVLPYAKRRSVGPFVFFDHIGPADFASGKGIDVRPHPHIGLATVTYLFDGEILHRDSLGSVQHIRPGDMNWMVAGHGIVHSERTSAETREAGQTLHGIQSWMALPKPDEKAKPEFVHHPSATLPNLEQPGAQLKIIAGTAFGQRSPVKVLSDTLYFHAELETGATLSLSTEHTERAIYVVGGRITIDGTPLEAMQMGVLIENKDVKIECTAAARLMLLGGAPLDGPRLMWWNFVASDQNLMDQAKADWAESPDQNWQGRFKLPPDESEFIPLPEE